MILSKSDISRKVKTKFMSILEEAIFPDGYLYIVKYWVLFYVRAS